MGNSYMANQRLINLLLLCYSDRQYWPDWRPLIQSLQRASL